MCEDETRILLPDRTRGRAWRDGRRSVGAVGNFVGIVRQALAAG